MSIWSKLKDGLKKAGQVAGDVLGGAVGTVEDGGKTRTTASRTTPTKTKDTTHETRRTSHPPRVRPWRGCRRRGGANVPMRALPDDEHWIRVDDDERESRDIGRGS